MLYLSEFHSLGEQSSLVCALCVHLLSQRSCCAVPTFALLCHLQKHHLEAAAVLPWCRCALVMVGWLITALKCFISFLIVLSKIESERLKSRTTRIDLPISTFNSFDDYFMYLGTPVKMYNSGILNTFSTVQLSSLSVSRACFPPK